MLPVAKKLKFCIHIYIDSFTRCTVQSYIEWGKEKHVCKKYKETHFLIGNHYHVTSSRNLFHSLTITTGNTLLCSRQFWTYYTYLHACSTEEIVLRDFLVILKRMRRLDHDQMIGRTLSGTFPVSEELMLIMIIMMLLATICTHEQAPIYACGSRCQN